MSRSKQSRLPLVLVHPQPRFDPLTRAAKRGMWKKGKKLKETPAEYKKRHAAGGGTTITAKGT